MIRDKWGYWIRGILDEYWGISDTSKFLIHKLRYRLKGKLDTESRPGGQDSVLLVLPIDLGGYQFY